jgi:hypothetical protein
VLRIDGGEPKYQSGGHAAKYVGFHSSFAHLFSIHATQMSVMYFVGLLCVKSRAVAWRLARTFFLHQEISRRKNISYGYFFKWKSIKVFFWEINTAIAWLHSHPSNQDMHEHKQ